MKTKLLGKIAVIALVGAAGAVMFEGWNAPKAHAAPSFEVPCSIGPNGSRLEADCTNIDPGFATMEVSGWCTNLVGFDDFIRLGGHERRHVTKECGPGAHPILWWINAQSDYEHLLQLRQQKQDERNQEQANANSAGAS